jgi:hypothetical protein
LTPRRYHRAYHHANGIARGALLWLLLLVVATARSIAQTTPPPARGEYDVAIGIRIGQAMHDLSANIDVPTTTGADSAHCGIFQEGSGDAFDVGLIGSFRFNQWLAVDAGIGASFVSDRLAFPCLERADIRQPDGTLTSAQTEFVRASTGNLYEAELGLRAMPVRSVPVWIGMVGRIRIEESADVEYQEEVVAPVGAIFLGIGEIRPIATRRNDVMSASLTFGPTVSADIRVGERVRLRPQLSYLFDLGDLGASPSLRRNRFHTSLSLEFLFSTGNAHSTPLEPQGN